MSSSPDALELQGNVGTSLGRGRVAASHLTLSVPPTPIPPHPCGRVACLCPLRSVPAALMYTAAAGSRAGRAQGLAVSASMALSLRELSQRAIPVTARQDHFLGYRILALQRSWQDWQKWWEERGREPRVEKPCRPQGWAPDPSCLSSTVPALPGAPTGVCRLHPKQSTAFSPPSTSGTEGKLLF